MKKKWHKCIFNPSIHRDLVTWWSLWNLSFKEKECTSVGSFKTNFRETLHWFNKFRIYRMLFYMLWMNHNMFSNRKGKTKKNSLIWLILERIARNKKDFYRDCGHKENKSLVIFGVGTFLERKNHRIRRSDFIS